MYTTYDVRYIHMYIIYNLLRYAVIDNDQIFYTIYDI